VSADRPSGASLRGVEKLSENSLTVPQGPVTGDLASFQTVSKSGVERVLRVQTTFHVADEAQGQAVAAKLIDRAHELANSPECECDLDVSVEWVEPEDLLATDPGGVPSSGMAATDRRSANEQPVAR
jgi:hypothetical protein